MTADQKTKEWKFIAGPVGSGASGGIYQDAKIFAIESVKQIAAKL